MIIIDYKDRRPLYEQIEERFRELILHGALETDSRIPSVRSLAMDLSINPNTIQRAYTELETDGYLYTVKGKGNFVADITNLIPLKRTEFYDKLDSLLHEAAPIGIRLEDILSHTEQYFKKEVQHG